MTLKPSLPRIEKNLEVGSTAGAGRLLQASSHRLGGVVRKEIPNTAPEEFLARESNEPAGLFVYVGVAPVAIEEYEPVGDTAPNGIGTRLRLLGSLPRKFLLLVKTGVLDGDGSLLRHGSNEPLGRQTEHTCLGVSEEQAANDFPVTRLHRHR